ncbi:unnamed protein product [Symbiodinium microadriaticum]|nr:unnamed protein product [Symbiodinium microadriaticum]
MLVMSPPCQPWAAPGKGQGLDTPDGRLLLRVAALMQVVRTPVVCIEGVAGFAAHPHFADVMEAWREAGYQLVSREMLQLAEVAPTWRRRLMLVFVHQETGPGVDAAQGFVPWQAVPRPSLAIMRAFFQSCLVALHSPAALTISNALRWLAPHVRLDPAEVVRRCIDERLQGRNSVLLKVKQDWDLRAQFHVLQLGLIESGARQVEKQALLVPGQHGLVRGKSRYGLRVGTHAFQYLFKQLRPGEPVPATIDTKLLFKVGPLPPAAPSEALTEWACQLPWQIRVLKSLGPRFWLVGAPMPPPTYTARFNDTAVLITEVKNRDMQAPIVQAGGSVPRPPQKDTRDGPKSSEADPWLESDPWLSDTCSICTASLDSPATARTYLELVVDFVASTKVCPPHELAAARALDKPPKLYVAAGRVLLCGGRETTGET